MRTSLFVLLASLLAACGSNVGAYCEKEAECWENDCDASEDACAEWADGRRASCEATAEANINAIATGDSNVCDDCIDAKNDYLACMGDLQSCTDFQNEEGCQGEKEDQSNACQDVRERCQD